jgi:hypothetical protein
LAEDCNSEFHAILLSLLRSQNIINKFNEIFAQLNAKEDYYEVTIGILILTVLNYSTSTNLLFELYGTEINSSGFRRDPVIRQIFDFSKEKVILRSAIAARFILNHVADVYIIIDVLSRLAKKSDELFGISPDYRRLFVNLQQFSCIQSILPEKEKRKAIIDYYESIRTLGHCRVHPLFWLQYGIGCLVMEELDRAEKYFDTAYSLAEKRDNYDTYQIDNHYARLLLKKAIKMPEVEGSLEYFRKSVGIITEQIRRERRYYPYRVAALYAEYYDSKESSFKNAEKTEIAQAADFVRSKIERLSDYRKHQKHIQKCDQAMSYILKKTKSITKS